MNILYINHYAGSPSMGMGYRVYYLAREWTKAGHNVLIVCSSFSHIRRKQADDVEKSAFVKVCGNKAFRCKIDGLDYLVLRTCKYNGNGIKRALNMMSFVGKLFTVARAEVLRFHPNVIIASSTYTWDNWAACYYARKCNAKYVYEVRDIWPLTPMKLGHMSKWNPFIWLLQRAENFACKNADVIVGLLPAANKHLEKHGMSPGKYVWVPNGVVLEEWPNEVVLRKTPTNLQFTIAYVGGHALSNALDTFCEAAALLPDVKFVLVGSGVQKPRLMAKCADMRNVEFREAVPKSEIPYVLKQFDCLYIGWMKNPLYQYGISPNKLYDYMMSGTPIVHAVEAANDPVAEAKCGISCEPESADALVDAITKMRAFSVEERQRMGWRGHEYVMKNHLIPELAQRFSMAFVK